MNKRIRYGLMGIAILASFIAGNAVMKWYQGTQPPEQAAKAMQNTQRPGFILPDLEGKMRDVREWDGQVLVLNFWATWCPPCVEELPLLDAFYRENAPSGWQVLGLAVDKAEPVRSFLSRRPLGFPVALAGVQGLALSQSLGNLAGGLPFSVLISATGSILDRKIGKLSRQDLARWRALK
jgi:thiol-disulfide isomerase/thioredoxin